MRDGSQNYQKSRKNLEMTESDYIDKEITGDNNDNKNNNDINANNNYNQG